MNILRIADVPDNRTGGMSRTMYCTGDVLVAEGHTVDYLFSGNLRTAGPVALRRFTVPLRLPTLVREMARRSQRYDVVEIHEPLAAPYCFARKFWRDLPPAVIFSYGLEERSRIAEINYRRGKGLPVSLKKRYSPLTVVWQAVYGTRHCNHVICSNSEDVTHLAKHGVPPERLTRHFSGVDADLLALALAKNPVDTMRSGILFLGSWLLRKGILDLVPAVTQVLRRFPEIGMTIAGSGVSAEVIMRNFPYDTHSQITVVPAFSGNQALSELYSRHSIFVLPSYFEGQPLVMIEAAAFGLAIVTTKVCGMVDFIEDECNGLFVPVGDLEALVAQIDRLIVDPTLAHFLGASAQRSAQSHTWESAAQNILQAYEKAVKGHPLPTENIIPVAL